MGEDPWEQFRETVMNELYRIRNKQDDHSDRIADLKTDLSTHKAKTSIFSMILGAIAGFLSHFISK